MNDQLVTRGIAENTARCRVELLIRTSVPTPVRNRIETIVDRIESLDVDESVSEVECKHWPPDEESVSVSPSREELLDRFDAWADDAGCQLEPAFQTEAVNCEMPGSIVETARHRVPFLTLVIYGDGSEDIEFVAPCVKGNDVITIEDCLTQLELTGFVGDDGSNAQGPPDQPARTGDGSTPIQ